MKTKRGIETFGQEQTWLKFALTDTNLEEGNFRGIASVFGIIVQSWMPTVIESGAFTKTLKENGDRIKILHQHDPFEPVGKPTSLFETELGLEIAGKVSQTTRGKDDLILMRDGVLDELSIGFDPIKWEMEKNVAGEVIRHIKELRLWEVSLVTFAANPFAKVMSVHAQSDSLDSILEQLLAAVPLEAHEGKVLSVKNKKLLENALAALTALIVSAEPPADEPAQGTIKQALTVNMERLIQLASLQLWQAEHIR